MIYNQTSQLYRPFEMQFLVNIMAIFQMAATYDKMIDVLVALGLTSLSRLHINAISPQGRHQHA